MRYSIFLGRRHNSCWTHSPQTRSCNNMAVFWSYFRDFVGAQKIEDLSESKNFFAEVFQITSRFVLARKKIWGKVHFKLTGIIWKSWYRMSGKVLAIFTGLRRLQVSSKCSFPKALLNLCKFARRRPFGSMVD